MTGRNFAISKVFSHDSQIFLYFSNTSHLFNLGGRQYSSLVPFIDSLTIAFYIILPFTV